jgi:hypothetical protein
MGEVALPHDPQEPVYPFRGDEPVVQAVDRIPGYGQGSRQGRVRGRRQDVEEPLEEPADLEDAAEGERRGDERRRLGVPRVGVAVGEQDRVGLQVGSPPFGQQLLQPGGKRRVPRGGIACRTRGGG